MSDLLKVDLRGRLTELAERTGASIAMVADVAAEMVSGVEDPEEAEHLAIAQRRLKEYLAGAPTYEIGEVFADIRERRKRRREQVVDGSPE